MKKLLGPKDLLLLGLGNILDLFEEAKDPFGLVANSHKHIYGWVPRRFKRHNFTRLVRRQLKTNNIEKVEKKGEIYIRLTVEGQDRIKRDFSLLNLAKQRWDERWRIVIFDIAESSKKVRNILRARLKELGFGMLQKSVWLTPHDIIIDLKEFIDSKGLEDSVFVMEVTHLAAGDPRVLADKIWNLEGLNQEYSEIIDEVEKLEQEYIVMNDRIKQCTYKSTRSASVMIKRIENKLVVLKRKYLQVIMSDPHLPKELLPVDWKRDEVLQILKSVSFRR